jgi:predicted MFS family arabinose efflux permease
MDDFEDLGLIMLWMACGIAAGFTLYSYLSPRIQKPAAQAS